MNFKYNIGDTVYFVEDYSCRKGKIVARKIITDMWGAPSPKYVIISGWKWFKSYNLKFENDLFGEMKC